MQWVSIYNNEEDIAIKLLFHFSKIYNMFLSKIQQSYCYTQLCNYRETFIFEPVSNQLQIFGNCNFSFTRSLNVSYLEMDE